MSTGRVTVSTFEFRLGGSILLVDVVTLATFQGGEGRFHQSHGNALSEGFVETEEAELEEGPGTSGGSVLTTDLFLVKEIDEVFHRQSNAKRLRFSNES